MTVNATDFKSKCLQLMERVKNTHEPILITKRGKVVAQLAPAPPSSEKPWLCLRGTVTINGDIVGPVLTEKELRKQTTRGGKQLRGLFD